MKLGKICRKKRENENWRNENHKTMKQKRERLIAKGQWPKIYQQHSGIC